MKIDREQLRRDALRYLALLNEVFKRDLTAPMTSWEFIRRAKEM